MKFQAVTSAAPLKTVDQVGWSSLPLAQAAAMGARKPPTFTTHFMNQLHRLFQLIPVVGILTSVLIYVSILAAVAAMRRLRNSYRSRFGLTHHPLPRDASGKSFYDQTAGYLRLEMYFQE